MGMSTVYGPVFNWRLGCSLGVDILRPPKKCTFNCLYCPLGKTGMHVTKPENMVELAVKADQIMNDLDISLKCLDINTLDVVTFCGIGEPTLNTRLGDIASMVKEKVKPIPLAILTNSSLLYRNDIKRNLSQFDVVIAKLDAGDEETFSSINRPADKTLTIKMVINSIKKLRSLINGQLILEAMIIRSKNSNISNAKGKPLRSLISAILDLKPDLLHLNVPYRPPSESFIVPPSQERMRMIFEDLSERLGEDKVLAYGVRERQEKRAKWLNHRSPDDECIELLKRRPSNLTEISLLLGIDEFAARKLLRRLRDRNVISEDICYGSRYYRWIDKMVPQKCS